MNRIALFWGCRIQTSQYAYELSLRSILPLLNIEIAELKDASCCGDPVKSVNSFAATYLAARVLALANATNAKDLLVPCNRCHLTLSETKHLLSKDAGLLEKISALLAEENLSYDPAIRIWHTIDFLHDFVGLEKIRGLVVKPLTGLRIATHVGCQLIRPSDIARADDSEKPEKLDALVRVLGAEPVDYPEKLDCCGAMLLFSHQDAALSLAGSKLNAVQGHEVDALVDSCPAGHLILDAKQDSAGTAVGAKLSVPVIYYTQLLGIAMGIAQEKLGLHLNLSPIEQFLEKIKPAT